ncbi:hypothetical protein [Natronomonas sp.]|uniref:hypothetical protein n=1 Tax=Natronomonas sp. TaxID=2184060 RepID=UPI0039759A53
MSGPPRGGGDRWGDRQAFLSGLTPTERELLEGVFEAAFIGAQRATLLLLVVFATLTLVISAFLPHNSGNQ